MSFMLLQRSLKGLCFKDPKISAKDNVRLRDLGDLLMEIQGAKEDGYLTGLAYLDTSHGISPIASLCTTREMDLCRLMV